MPPSWVPISPCMKERLMGAFYTNRKAADRAVDGFGEVAMYKKQMTLQRILCLAAVAVCALVFFYSLGIMTDLYDGMYFLWDPDKLPEQNLLQGANIYYDMQPFNKQFTNYSIYFLLLACLLFLTNTHNRRKYYVGNAVSTGLFAVGGIAISVWGHIQISAFKHQFLTTIDFAAYKKIIDDAAKNRKSLAAKYIDSTFWFDVHYVVFGLVLLVCLLLLANFAWKMFLMNKEKELLAQGKAVAE